MTISIIRSSPIWTPFSEQRSSKIGRSRRKRPSRNRSPFRRSGKCVAFSVNRDSIDAFNRMTSDPDFDDLVLDDQFYEVMTTLSNISSRRRLRTSKKIERNSKRILRGLPKPPIRRDTTCPSKITSKAVQTFRIT